MSNSLQLKVKNVVRETKDAISIHFEKPTGHESYFAGQFLTLIMPIQGKSVRRAYSLCSSPLTDQNWAVAVKRVEGGLMSTHLNAVLKTGDTMEILPPMGNFIVKPDPTASRHFVLFAGGSGVTPMYSIAKTLLKGEQGSYVSMIYGNRDIDSIILKWT